MALFCVWPALGQDQAPGEAIGQPDEKTDESGAQVKSGYEDIPQFGGPSSVGAELEEDHGIKEALIEFPALDQALRSLNDAKEQIDRAVGLQFGLHYDALGGVRLRR